MQPDPTQRFSSRVEDYIRYRPDYPPAIVPLLVRECGLQPGMAVADIGSGTGFSVGMFLRFGCEVFGVEPNQEMRLAGERLLADHPGFHSIGACAESTGLPDGSVDLVFCGQSFHWFDREKAAAEFRRISRPPHRLVLVWNERLVSGSFLEKYEALLQRYSTDYAQVDHRRVGPEAMDRIFGPSAWRVASFANEQRFDLAGVLGRLHSSSYAPPPGTEAYARINEEMTRLFEESAENGEVVFRYETKVFYGELTVHS
jgi:SAM-dependent methyltransferase